MAGFFLAKKPYGAHGAVDILAPPPPSVLRRAPVLASSSTSRISTSSSLLFTRLESIASSLLPLRGESVPILHYTLALTGHPPLVSRSDVTKDGQPDFTVFGLSPALGPAPHFFVVDPFVSGGANVALVSDSPFRSVSSSEDTIRDVFMGVLHSPGKVREGFGAIPVCKASPVTSPYACLTSLRMTAATKHAFTIDGIPRPATEGGPLVLDIGHTAGGFYGLLAASSGVSALTIDTQPQCAMWARLSARASGVSHLINSFTAIPLPPSTLGKLNDDDKIVVTIDARVRTGCIGTLTTMQHASSNDVDAFYGGVPSSVTPGNEDGREKTERTRKFTGTEGLEVLGNEGGGLTVKIPVSSVDSILCATYGGGLCEDGSTTDATTPLILIAKIDARGREAAVLEGMKFLLKSPTRRPRNLLVEVNKNHIAAVLGLPSAKAVPNKGETIVGDMSDDALVRGYSLSSDIIISDDDNLVIAQYLMDTMTTLMTAGYEVLVSDRGWWCAQDPFRPPINLDPKAPLLHDTPTSLESWADKLSRRGEVDLWAYVAE